MGNIMNSGLVNPKMDRIRKLALLAVDNGLATTCIDNSDDGLTIGEYLRMYSYELEFRVKKVDPVQAARETRINLHVLEIIDFMNDVITSVKGPAIMHKRLPFHEAVEAFHHYGMTVYLADYVPGVEPVGTYKVDNLAEVDPLTVVELINTYLRRQKSIHKISQADMAARAGISPATISVCLRGTGIATLDSLLKILFSMGKTLSIAKIVEKRNNVSIIREDAKHEPIEGSLLN